MNHRRGLRRTFMHRKTHGSEPIDNLLPPQPKLLFRVAEYRKVVDVAKVSPNKEIPLDEMVERIHRTVGPKL